MRARKSLSNLLKVGISSVVSSIGSDASMIDFMNLRRTRSMFFTRNSSIWGSKGLTTYASAPLSKPSIVLCWSFLAVSSITGICDVDRSFLSLLQSSMPSISGIITSDTTMSTGCSEVIFNASTPLVAVYTLYDRLNVSLRKARSSGLSSTSSILMRLSGLAYSGTAGGCSPSVTVLR